MKKLNYRVNGFLFLLTISFLLMVSCQSPVKRVITNKGLSQDIIEIRENMKELDDIQASFLDYLEKYYSKSVDANSLIDLLEKQQVTYKQMFNLLDTLETELKPYELERKEIIEKIDNKCSKIQKNIDKQQYLRDSLNNLIITNVLIVQKTQKGNIEIKTMFKNNSNQLIDKVTFDLIFSINDNHSFIIPCSLEQDLDLDLTLIHNFLFNKVKNEKEFNLLESMELPVFSSSFQIKSIKYKNGNFSQISLKYYYQELYKNKNYSDSKQYDGFCPYLTNYDSLHIALKVANEKYISLIDTKAPYLKEFFNKYQINPEL